jgi:hypothetical protein
VSLIIFVFTDQPEDSDDEEDDEEVENDEENNNQADDDESEHEQPDIEDIIQPEPFLPVLPEDIDLNDSDSDVSSDGKLLLLKRKPFFQINSCRRFG